MTKAVISLMVTISFLASLIGGLCSDVHAETHCSNVAGSYCETGHEKQCDSSIPCDSGHDHPEDGHCDDCCGCSCFRTVVSHIIGIKYSPFVESLFVNEPFTLFPEVFIPKFVPPESIV